MPSIAKKISLVRTEKKVHWTQRPENKKKLKLMTKRAARTRRAMKKVAPSSPVAEIHDKTVPQDTFAYALGHIECWIEAYAKSAGIPSEALASQLGKVLSIKSRGK